MLTEIKKQIWQSFKFIDAILKFPNLKPGEIGIQLGFDMGYPSTSDLFTLYHRVKPSGMVYGIDPDMSNINKAQQIIDTKNLNIKLVHKAVFSEKGEVELITGERPEWNQLGNIPVDNTVDFKGSKISVPMDTLDNIIKDYNIDAKIISHINITINGSEYYALLGMTELLKKTENINLTIASGRYDESGLIEGRQDYEMIINLLKELGFNYKFKRIHQLFWWGFVTKLILNRKWIYGKKNYGIIMAAKGDKKLKWYQSFS